MEPSCYYCIRNKVWQNFQQIRFSDFKSSHHKFGGKTDIMIKPLTRDCNLWISHKGNETLRYVKHNINNMRTMFASSNTKTFWRYNEFFYKSLTGKSELFPTLKMAISCCMTSCQTETWLLWLGLAKHTQNISINL